jgi:hypothetical protein
LGAAPLAIVIPFTLLLVVASVVAQVTMAILMPRDAAAAADERERLAIHKAGHWAGIVLAVIVVSAALAYPWQTSGGRLFQAVIGGLILSQLAEYGLQIVFFRRGA